MKIKSVCELTGLSDRTIRYYVEEKLISPSYTENYLGRKSFDFSKADVDTLNDIAVLRRFDFSVGEIRDIISDAENSESIIQSVKDRTELRVNDGRVLLEALSRIPADKAYTLASLAEQLSKPSSDLPLQTENIKISAKQTLISVIKSVLLFIAVWLPVAICGLIVGVTVNVYSYPVFYPKAIVFFNIIGFTLCRYACYRKDKETVAADSESNNPCFLYNQLTVRQFCFNAAHRHYVKIGNRRYHRISGR